MLPGRDSPLHDYWGSTLVSGSSDWIILHKRAIHIVHLFWLHANTAPVLKFCTRKEDQKNSLDVWISLKNVDTNIRLHLKLGAQKVLEWWIFLMHLIEYYQCDLHEFCYIYPWWFSMSWCSDFNCEVFVSQWSTIQFMLTSLMVVWCRICWGRPLRHSKTYGQRFLLSLFMFERALCWEAF